MASISRSTIGAVILVPVSRKLGNTSGNTYFEQQNWKLLRTVVPESLRQAADIVVFQDLDPELAINKRAVHLREASLP